MDPNLVFTVMINRFPEFAAAVLNECMTLSQAAAPNHKIPRKEYHDALTAASAQFLDSLCQEQYAKQVETVIPFDPESDDIVVNGIHFSRLHFAKNFNTRFKEDVKAYYAQTYGFVDVEGEVMEDGSGFRLALIADTYASKLSEKKEE